MLHTCILKYLGGGEELQTSDDEKNYETDESSDSNYESDQ